MRDATGTIADFTDAETWTLRSTPEERYGDMPELPFGTGIERFDNRAEGLVTLLQVQADHARPLHQAADNGSDD